MAVSYIVAVDRDDDGDFGGTGEDITRDVLSLRWRLGLAQAHDRAAEPGTAQITVRNHAQTYSPEQILLQPGQVLRIQSDDGTTVRTHFTGHISHVEPLPGDQGGRTAIIHAVDASAQLHHYDIRLPPQVNVTAGEVVDRILDRVPMRRTRLKGYWVLGRANYGELGSNTRLPIRTIERSLSTGQTLMAYVGDTWAGGITAVDAIRQLCESERGRFFIDREGQAVFYDRHILLGNIAPAAVFTDDMAGLDYTYGDAVVSHVQVRLNPRSVGAAAAALWELDEAQPLPDGEIRQMVVRFRDDNERPIGALAVDTLRPGVDYSANTAPDGTGLDLTGDVEVRLVQTDFSAALLEIHNHSRVPGYLLAGMRLRGTPLYTGDPVLVEQVSYGSLAFYSPRVLAFDLPFLNSVEQADSLARFELSRRKTPRGRFHRLTLTGQTHLDQILRRTLFDLITINEAQTGHEADYFIVAEHHDVELGGYRHRVTWMLESAEANRFWVLGRDHLAQTTVLAY